MTSEASCRCRHCFVGASFGINYQFANRSLLMWLVDAGYHAAQFVLFALVLALWP